MGPFTILLRLTMIILTQNGFPPYILGTQVLLFIDDFLNVYGFRYDQLKKTITSL